jgi:hypothetical protein
MLMTALIILGGAAAITAFLISRSPIWRQSVFAYGVGAVTGALIVVFFVVTRDNQDQPKTAREVRGVEEHINLQPKKVRWEDVAGHINLQADQRSGPTFSNPQ